MGQFHAFHIDVVLHLGGPFMQWQESINATYGVQEWQQRWLSPDEHLLGNRLDKRGIADELDGIAKAVVAAHQDPLARQRCAIPDVLQVPWPVPARHASPGTQHSIADGPRRLEGAASHVRHPAGCTRRTELTVHSLAHGSIPTAHLRQAYPKARASGSPPLSVRSSATAAGPHVVVGAALQSREHSAVPSGRRSPQMLRYAVGGWYSAASRRTIPG